MYLRAYFGTTGAAHVPRAVVDLDDVDRRRARRARVVGVDVAAARDAADRAVGQRRRVALGAHLLSRRAVRIAEPRALGRRVVDELDAMGGAGIRRAYVSGAVAI